MPRIIRTPAGERRHVVQVFARQPTAANELGSTAPVQYAPTVQLRAKVTPLSGTERYVNAQVVAGVTHEIRCDYTAALDTTCQLQIGGKTLDIVSILDIEEQHVEFVILASQSTGAASG